MDGTPSAGGGNFLTRKMGPLPLWAWLALVTVVVVFWAMKHKASSNSAAANQQQQAQQAADQAAATAAAAPYQPYTVPYVTSSMSYGGGDGSSGPNPTYGNGRHQGRRRPDGQPQSPPDNRPPPGDMPHPPPGRPGYGPPPPPDFGRYGPGQGQQQGYQPGGY